MNIRVRQALRYGLPMFALLYAMNLLGYRLAEAIFQAMQP